MMLIISQLCVSYRVSNIHTKLKEGGGINYSLDGVWQVVKPKQSSLIMNSEEKVRKKMFVSGVEYCSDFNFPFVFEEK